MTDRERRAWLRFLLIVVVAAIGESIAVWNRLPSAELLVPLLFGAATFFLTRRLATPRPRRSDNVRYWRGRPVDEDRLN